MTNPREMRGAEWADWLLGPNGERAYQQALLDHGIEPEDRHIGSASMPLLLRKIRLAVEALHRLREMQRAENATPEQVIATEAVLESLAHFDAALVHEFYFTARVECPCRTCRSHRA